MTDQKLPTFGINILIVDDDPNMREMLAVCLEEQGYHIVAVGNSRDALAEASTRSFDLAFVDLHLGTETGLSLIPELLAGSPWIKIIVMTAYASVDTAVEAMKRGAAEYLCKPFNLTQVTLMVRKLAGVRALEQKVVTLQEALGQADLEANLCSSSLAMQRALALARQVASSKATILIYGESGTGKGVLARAIHAWSPRSARPFSIVSCPSLSPELLESELFGHVKGSFTGAIRDNPGRIGLCEGGTLFLDEIGDLPLTLQPKLLRFLQDREYERVGDPRTRQADVRILAATSRNLDTAIKEGRFREDLFYRLNVIQVEIPPLRERPEDIKPLAERLLAVFNRENHKRILGFTEEALKALQNHTWPGNVRELRNVIERAVILCRTELIGIELVSFALPPPFSGSPPVGKLVSLAEVEREHIRRVLTETKSLEEAAQILGIDQATLWRRRKKYKI